MARFVLALDQGTTSSRSILFDVEGRIAAVAQREFRQIYPSPGLVEHDPEAIWFSQLETAQQAMTQAGAIPTDIAAIGITNQRETTILWDRSTGRPVHNAIVWQSRLTVPICEELNRRGLGDMIRSKTGLVIDAYFSGTKIKWLLDKIPGARERASRGELLFGTVDTFLLWRLSGGRIHATDYSNASRTLLFNIHTLHWDDELLAALDVPRALLPEVLPSSHVYGYSDPSVLGAAIPLAGVAGDQQAATFGQVCFEPGTAKNTYGTGCFMLLNTGGEARSSANGLLTTIGWGLGSPDRPQITYALEGSVFVAGAAVQWLRDSLGLIHSSDEVTMLATQVSDAGGVYMVPAFVGLGAPYWDGRARGAILGLTRGSSAAHIARAVLESMAYQTRDVLEAMHADSGVALKELRVDGGASVNDVMLQFQADMLGVPVIRPKIRETTALGAAYLAGLATGFWRDQSQLASMWAVDRVLSPSMPAEQRERLYAGWKKAVGRSREWEE